jgi:hypothetical protein
MDRNENRTGIFHTIDGERREIVIELPDPVQMDIYASWTPAQRLKAGREQCRFVRRMLRSQLGSLHPEWSPEELDRAVAERILGYAL